jgi:hypothetical protein
MRRGFGVFNGAGHFTGNKLFGTPRLTAQKHLACLLELRQAMVTAGAAALDSPQGWRRSEHANGQALRVDKQWQVERH